MYNNNSIAVVIPAYNAEKLIGKVIETIPEYVDKIVIVDDKSEDKTMEMVETHQRQQSPRIVLLKNETNQGCGGSLAKGYQWARDNAIDVAVRMDADGQMDPQDMPALLEPIVHHHADYTKGNRLFTGEAYRKIPKLRYYGNAILSLLTKIASGYWHVADSQSGYTAMNRKVLETIDWDKMYKRYGQPNDLLVRLNIYNFHVKDVAVTPVYNIGEKSGICLRVVIFTISGLLWNLFWWRLKEKYVIRDFHPLVFFYLLGFGLLVVSGALFIRLLLFWTQSGHIPPINALAWMFSFSLGFQSLFFAMWFDMQYNKDFR